MSYSLFDEMESPEAAQKTRKMAHAVVASQAIEPYLMDAKSASDFENRVGMAEDRIRTAALDNDVDYDELVDHYRKKASILIEAKESANTNGSDLQSKLNDISRRDPSGREDGGVPARYQDSDSFMEHHNNALNAHENWARKTYGDDVWNHYKKTNWNTAEASRTASMQRQAAKFDRKHYETVAEMLGSHPDGAANADHFEKNMNFSTPAGKNHTMDGRNKFHQQVEQQANGGLLEKASPAHLTRGHHDDLAHALSGLPGDHSDLANHMSNYLSGSKSFNKDRFMNNAGYGQQKQSSMHRQASAYDQDPGQKDGYKYAGGVKFAGGPNNQGAGSSRAYSSSGRQIGHVSTVFSNSGPDRIQHEWHHTPAGTGTINSGRTETHEEARQALANSHAEYRTNNVNHARGILNEMNATAQPGHHFGVHDTRSIDPDRNDRSWVHVHHAYPNGQTASGPATGVKHEFSLNLDTGQMHAPTPSSVPGKERPQAESSGHASHFYSSPGPSTPGRRTAARRTAGKIPDHLVGHVNDYVNALNQGAQAQTRHSDGVTSSEYELKSGPKYTKVMKHNVVNGQRVPMSESYHSFVNHETGDVHKADGPRPGSARYSLTDPDSKSALLQAASDKNSFTGGYLYKNASFDQRMAMIRQALADGVDPLQLVVQDTEARAQGGAPEKPGGAGIDYVQQGIQEAESWDDDYDSGAQGGPMVQGQQSPKA